MKEIYKHLLKDFEKAAYAFCDKGGTDVEYAACMQLLIDEWIEESNNQERKEFHKLISELSDEN